jgi:hypothetical protein
MSAAPQDAGDVVEQQDVVFGDHDPQGVLCWLTHECLRQTLFGFRVAPPVNPPS